MISAKRQHAFGSQPEFENLCHTTKRERKVIVESFASIRKFQRRMTNRGVMELNYELAYPYEQTRLLERNTNSHVLRLKCV